MRVVCAIVLVVGFAVPAKAENVRGWGFSGSFNGSANYDGAVTKAEPMLKAIHALKPNMSEKDAEKEADKAEKEAKLTQKAKPVT